MALALPGAVLIINPEGCDLFDFSLQKKLFGHRDLHLG
jgi:hypothetical protein